MSSIPVWSTKRLDSLIDELGTIKLAILRIPINELVISPQVTRAISVRTDVVNLAAW